MTLHGIINLLKPAGMTSHDAVYFLRKLTGEKKIGHTGTLDPMAVGVLPLCIGQATRIIDYLDPDDKAYRCEMLLGLETNTWDIWGEAESEELRPAGHVTADALAAELARHIGDIRQTPPQYSSVRIDGRHLYEYARSGLTVEVAARAVSIRSIRLLCWNPETQRAMFDVVCSKGTYIRSLCHDVGRALGVGAAMSFLARTATGAFRIDQAATFEELSEDWQNRLLPEDYPLDRYGALAVAAGRIPWVANGGSLRQNEVRVLALPEPTTEDAHCKTRPHLNRAYRLYSEGRFLAMMLYDEERREYVADKVFCRS